MAQMIHLHYINSTRSNIVLVTIMLVFNVYQQVRLQFSTKRTDRTLECRANFVRRELRTFDLVNLNKMTPEVMFLGRLIVANRTRKSRADAAF